MTFAVTWKSAEKVSTSATGDDTEYEVRIASPLYFTYPLVFPAGPNTNDLVAGSVPMK